MEEEVREIAEEVKEVVKEIDIKCDFIFKTETGLKIHNTEKHNISLMKM